MKFRIHWILEIAYPGRYEYTPCISHGGLLRESRGFGAFFGAKINILGGLLLSLCIHVHNV